jgi:tRNA G37 N-methylase Trm5
LRRETWVSDYLNLYILAQVVLDKLSNVKTVVNKLHEIDSVYRNFELEILAGEPNTIVKCRESKAIFQFDFAKVYWNPRLSKFISNFYFNLKFTIILFRY